MLRINSLGGVAVLAALVGFTSACTKTPEPEKPDCQEQPGIACIWAGATGALGFNGDGHDRRDTMLYWPIDMEFAPDGTPWILDWNNHLIRKLNGDQTFTTVVGSFLGDGAADGSDAQAPGAPGLEVSLNHPTDIVFKADGTLVFAAWHNHKIRELDPTTGNVVIVYGKGPGFAGDGATDAATIRFNQPSKIAFDSKGSFYVVDQRNFRVRKISADGSEVGTLAGNGKKGFSGDTGPAIDAQLEFEAGPNPEPSGAVAVRTSDDAVFVADALNHRVRMIDKNGIITTIAGTGTDGFSGDGGKATDAELSNVKDMEFGPDGRLYLADADNNRIRSIDLATGLIETVAGNGTKGSDEVDGIGARDITLYRPFGIAFDAAGSLYISDTFNSRIIKVPGVAVAK